MSDPSSVEQFMQITGSDSTTADFFLGAANGDCDGAVSAYFESDGVVPAPAAAPLPPSHAARPPAPSGASSSSAPGAAAPFSMPPSSSAAPGSSSRGASWTAGAVAAAAAAASGGSANVRGGNPAPAGSGAGRGARRRPTSRFATLGSLERERDDDEKGYYAGGERSGQMIQDPRRPGSNNNDRSNRRAGDIHGPSTTPSANPAATPPTGPGGNPPAEDAPVGLADSILERARARGPRTEEEREHFEGPQRFSGAGYRLGDETVPVVARPLRPTIVGRRNVTRLLTFYANGFQVDDGPLRHYDDPANEMFLADVNRGIVPREMEEAHVGDVSITLVDKKGIEFEEKRAPIVPFSGGGQRLTATGDATAPASSSANSSRAQVDGVTVLSNAATTGAGQINAAAAAHVLTVDDSRPVTRVQVRLNDGTRLVARLNEDNTVGQLREFVRASHPSVVNFTLSTTFPKKLLEDDAATIKDAGLKGAVVVQTLL